MSIVIRKEKYLINSKYGCSFSFVKNTYLKRHTHDYYELFLVTDGEAIHELNEYRYNLKKGDLCLLRPGDVHCYIHAGTGNFELFNYMFSKKQAQKIFEFLTPYEMIKNLEEQECPMIIHLDPVTTDSYMERSFDITALSPCRGNEIALKLKLLFFDMVRSMVAEMEKKSHTPHAPIWFENLLMDMKESANYLLGVKQMEVLSGRSLEYISRLFKKHMDMTPTEYLNEAKLQNARMLLTNTDKSVLDISLAAGFNTLSNFYKAFEDRFGIAPGNFRKTLLGGFPPEPNS